MRFFPLVSRFLVGGGVPGANLPPQLYARAPQAHSPPSYPSPWMDPQADGWADAYAKAKAFVSQLTLTEKVNLTTGVG